MITWPPIDDHVRRSVLAQLDTSVSIYDRSGIIARFEDAFARHHNAGYALLTSSGTAALHSAYYGLGIGPGDEVLVQNYTFLATAMPLFQLGATPVLVDVIPAGDEEGHSAEVDLERAAELLTPRTKALVITHMWGHPHNTQLLRSWCDAHQIALVEDCSHAHGASRWGFSVGELADAAVWSLQGKKTITAGEGGILTTPHREVYDRATLLGHFNKRALQTVDPDSPLAPYAGTGLGLKYRINPIGLAMAEVGLRRLDGWLEVRRQHAERLQQAVHRPGIDVLTPTGNNFITTLYAFVFAINDEAGFTRNKLLNELALQGCLDVERCDSMPPLHTYPIFQKPISPVTTYTTSPIRTSLHVSKRLAATTLRIDVPAVDNQEGRVHINTVIDALNRALDKLSSATVGA